MRKTVLTIILILSMALPAKAFLPLAIPPAYFAASLALHVAAAAVGIYYAMKQGSSSSVDTSGNITRPSQVTYIDLTLNPPAVVEKSITAKIPYSDVKNISDKHPSDYPNIQNSLYSTTDPNYPPYDGSKAQTAGTKFSVGNTGYHIIGSQGKWTFSSYAAALSGLGQTPGVVYGGNTIVAIYQSGSAYVGERYVCQSDGATTPVKMTNTPPAFAGKMASSGGSGAVNPAYQAEIDKMMQDPNYVPTFTDDTTGLPYAPPPSSSVMTPSQLQTYNANGQAQQSAQDAATSSGNAATNAGNAYTNSGGNLATGQGGDPALYQKYLDALAAQKAAQAAADKLAADQAAQQESGTDDSSYTGTFDGSTPYGDQSKDFNFGTRFQTFVNQMKGTAIFSLPNQFLAGIPSSSTSSMSFSGGRFGQFSYDFAQFNGVFVVLKAIVLVLFGWVSIRIVLLKGGSQ